MSQFHSNPHAATAKPGFDTDIIDVLDDSPNGRTNGAFLSPGQAKTAASDLLDPEAFGRLSMSTVSTLPHSRTASPFPLSRAGEKPWRGAARRWWHRNQGLVLVTLSQASGAAMNVTTRLLETEGGGLGPFQVLFVRMLLTTCVCCAWMRWQKIPDFPLGPRGLRGLLVARGLTGFFGIWGLYYSLQYLGVADAIVLTFLAPSLASYGCYLFLREPFPVSARYASLISLVGVVLIARPTTYFSAAATLTAVEGAGAANSTTAYHPDVPAATPCQRLYAVAAAMVGVLGSAGAYVAIRWIGKRAHPVICVNYFAAWSTIVSGVALVLAQPLHFSTTVQFALPRGLRQWTMVIFLGICGLFTQLLLTKGLAVGGRGNSTRATNMIYTHMLFALVLDRAVFDQSPGWWSLVGGGLILGSAVFVAMQRQEGGAGRETIVGTEEEEIGMLSLGGRVEAREPVGLIP
jgi:drug/metabolite transporter (DMT)-like permease